MTSSSSSCWTRFRRELHPSYPLFSLEETVDVVGAEKQAHNDNEKQEEDNISSSIVVAPKRCIDIRASFAPGPFACIIRLAFLIWAIQVFVEDVRSYPPHNLYIYMGYLTHWGHLLSIFYLTCSFLCTVIPSATHQSAADKEPKGHLVRTTWGLYSCVAPLEIAITILYWSAIASGGPFTYITVMEHGGVAALVLMDGLGVGLVPVRAKHIVFLMMICLSYLIWSFLDAVLEIGNGDWGPAYDDDALYPVLNWNDDRKGAVILSAFVICVLAPCLFYGCWLMSLRASFRKVASTKDDIQVQHAAGGCGCAGFDGSRRPLFSVVEHTDAHNNVSETQYEAMSDEQVV